MEKTENKGMITKFYNWLIKLPMKSLLSITLMAFIVVIILFSISFLPNVISKISSSLSAALYSVFVPSDKASMKADKSIIDTKDNFTINFQRGELTNGLFSIIYACTDGADLYSVEKNGLKKITCDKPYYLIENEDSIVIKAETEKSVARLVIEGDFENNNTQKVEKIGVVRVTVKNLSTEPASLIPKLEPVITKSPSTQTQNTSYQTNYTGQADLAVRVLQIGRLNSGTNIITTQSQFTYSDMVGIKFEIRNDGEGNTGPWNFTAVLPSLSTPVFNSKTQISLKPGESIIFTLGFSDLSNEKNGIITINVDPQNAVKESLENNNFATNTIVNKSYNSNYYDNYRNYYSNNDDLEVSCYADPDDPETGDRVRWYADVSGGDGDYDYDWTGTNNLDSSSKSPSKTYSSQGTKRATVTVTDGDNNEASDTCTVYVD